MSGRLLVTIASLLVGITVGAAAVRVVFTDAPEAENKKLAGGDMSVGDQLRNEFQAANVQERDLVVDSLVRIIDEEIRERRLLSAQIEELESELAALQQRLGARPEPESGAEMRERRRQVEEAARQSREERLVAAGFTPDQLRAIERREAEAVMRQIEFDDRARREGWVNSPRYFSEAATLGDGAQAVRRELGEDAYDRYLYASGRANRLVVANVIATSPAERAGFQSGDVILSYADQRVFSTQQLTDLRSSGQDGAPVTVDILRDGRPMQLTLPRGPMGVRTAPTSVDPSQPPAR